MTCLISVAFGERMPIEVALQVVLKKLGFIVIGVRAFLNCCQWGRAAKEYFFHHQYRKEPLVFW